MEKEILWKIAHFRDSVLIDSAHKRLKGTVPESMNFTTAVSMITTSRKRDSVLSGKEIKDKISKDKKKHKHHHHKHHDKDKHDKHEKSKKSSSKKKKHRGENSEDNVPLRQQHEGGEPQSQAELITPVISILLRKVVF